MSLEANFRLIDRCVGKALDAAALRRGWPKAIAVGNGTEFTSKALDEWAWRRGLKLDYTRPGKPTDNVLIESFNGRLRDEFLNDNELITMQDAREKLKAWLHDYKPPNSSLEVTGYGGDVTERVRQKEVNTTTGKQPDSSLTVTGYGGGVSNLSHEVFAESLWTSTTACWTLSRCLTKCQLIFRPRTI